MRIPALSLAALSVAGLAACSSPAPTPSAAAEGAPPYVVPAAARPAAIGGRMVGKAKMPEGLVANSGGTMAEQGGAVISNSGGNLQPASTAAAGAVPQGGGMASYRVGPGFGLLATGQKPLSGFTVRIVDAGGVTVRDAAGQSYETKTDAVGGFAFTKTPPGRNLVVQLALPGTLGRLIGFLPAAGPGVAREVDLEGVGTHVLGFVLEQVVRGEQARLDKLTAESEAGARVEAEAALTAAAAGRIDADSLAPAGLVKTIGVWRGLSKGFDAKMKDIETKLGG